METKAPMRIYAEGRYWVPEPEEDVIAIETAVVPSEAGILKNWQFTQYCEARGLDPQAAAKNRDTRVAFVRFLWSGCGVRG